MKTVHNNSMVAHLWANQSQAEAHNHGSVFSFRGPSIYSWRAEIARHVQIGENKAVLIADRHWSQRTCSHQNDMRRALGNVQRFHVADLGGNHDANRDHYADKIADLLDKASRARKYRDSYLGSVLSVAEEANAYAAFFGLDWHLGTDLGEIATQREWWAAQKAAREAEEQRKADERLAEAVAKWKAGNTGIMIGCASVIYLRAREEEGVPYVETSRGARFPVTDAVKAWRLISACRARGEGWERNGHVVRMGSFQLDSIDGEGNVKAGCHEVRFEESQRLATLLGIV